MYAKISLCLSVSVSLSLSLYLSLSVCLSLSLCFCLSLSLSPFKLQTLSKIVQIPLQYQQYLQHSCVHHELQTSTLDYGLAAAIGSLKITQQESTMTKLQKQCSLCLQLFDKQWALMKG